MADNTYIDQQQLLKSVENTNRSQEVASKTVMKVLRESHAAGQLDQIIKYWHLDLNELSKDFKKHGIVEMEEQITYLKFKQPRLYIYLGKMLGRHAEVNEYIEHNKRLTSPEDWSMHIHGYFIRWLQGMRELGEIKEILEGDKEIKINGRRCSYSGEVDLKGKACGYGIAKDLDINCTYVGTFFDDVPHGIVVKTYEDDTGELQQEWRQGKEHGRTTLYNKFDGKIYNEIYKESKCVISTVITSQPSEAYYKDGEAFNVLEQQDKLLAMSLQEQRIQTGQNCMVHNFFQNCSLADLDLNATLMHVKDLEDQFQDRAADLDEFRKQLLDLFLPNIKECPVVYLPKLLFSNYFYKNDTSNFNEFIIRFKKDENRFSEFIKRFKLFLLLTCKSDAQTKVEIFTELISELSDGQKVKRIHAYEAIASLKLMVLINLFSAMIEIGYIQKEIYIYKDYFVFSTDQLENETIQNIFKSKQEIKKDQFTKSITKISSWLLNPKELCEKIFKQAKKQILHQNVEEYQEQRKRAMIKLQWMADQKFSNEKKLLQKVKALESMVKRGTEIDAGIQDDFNQEVEIANKLDGLVQYQLLTPFSKTQLTKILDCIEDNGVVEEKRLLALLKKEFGNNQDWKDAFDTTPHLDLAKFFRSGLFKANNRQSPNTIDLKLLTLFAYYTCKQNLKTANYKKALFLVKLASHSDNPELLYAGNFMETIQLILRMASIGFINSLVEIDYMDELYSVAQMNSLQDSMTEICLEMFQELFNGSESIKKSKWLKQSQTSEYDWLWSFTTIREVLFARADVELLHINITETEKYLQRFKDQQQSIKQKAEKDEEQRKLREEAVLNVMKLHDADLTKIKNELQQPDLNQSQSKFEPQDRLALVIANEFYNYQYIGMDDLPETKDDMRNIMQTISMMGIPTENIFVEEDISHDRVIQIYLDLANSIIARTKKLSKLSGIMGGNFLSTGVEWERIKQYALQPNSSPDFAEIYLNPDEQKEISKLIKLQEQAVSVEAPLDRKSESKKICKLQWKRLKETVMQDRNTKKIRLQLKDHEKIIYQRYIEAEKKYPNFVENSVEVEFSKQVFLFIYVAGHGCSDNSQILLLNEQNIEKIFWKVEKENRKLLDRVGKECKMICVYDCCRENFKELKERITDLQKRNQVYTPENKTQTNIISYPIQSSGNSKQSDAQNTIQASAPAQPQQQMQNSKQTQPRGQESNTVPMNFINYFAIHGTAPGMLVDKKSKLAIELTRQLILSSMNLRSECIIPDCFIQFRGSQMKNSITNETSRYSIKFGLKSEYDIATYELFKEYGSKHTEEANGGQKRSYLQMFYGFQKSIRGLDNPLVWVKVKELEHKSQQNLTYLNKWTACVFGECGQGKSTFLNNLSKIVSEVYYKGAILPCSDFKSMQSFKAVTPCVQMGTVGNLTLIDTPGFNDSDVNRSDKSIFIEMIQFMRSMIQDKHQGISSFVQCIMPNAAHRITDTTVKAMNNILFILNSLNRYTILEHHPRILVIFNDVSIYGNDYDPVAIKNSNPQKLQDLKLSNQKRIKEYKTQLKEVAKRFYLHMDISDQTLFGTKTWAELKQQVLANKQYLSARWYEQLTEHEKDILEDLREFQTKLGDTRTIKQQRNPIQEEFIEQRIDYLLPEENFFFFKVFKDESNADKLRNEIEKQSLIQFIEDNKKSSRFYLKEGQLEPIQLLEEERDVLIEGMQTSLAKIAQEIIKSNQLTVQITGKPSQELEARRKEIHDLQKDFGTLLNQKPHVLQKCSFHGIILAKEIISKARDEVNEHCVQGLANEIKEKQEEIEQIREQEVFVPVLARSNMVLGKSTKIMGRRSTVLSRSSTTLSNSNTVSTKGNSQLNNDQNTVLHKSTKSNQEVIEEQKNERRGVRKTIKNVFRSVFKKEENNLQKESDPGQLNDAEQLKEEIRELNQALDVIEKDNKGLKGQIGGLKGQVNDLKIQNIDYQVQIGDLTGQVIDVKDEMKILQDQNEKFMKKIQELSAQNIHLTSQNKSLQAKLQNKK